MKYALPLLLALLLGPVWAQPSHPSWPPATYMVYYGDLNPESIARLRSFDLVIVHPGDERENLTPQKVKALKNGGKTIVIGYVSIGEDPEVPAGPPAPGPKQAGPSYFHQTWQTSDNDYPLRYLDQVRYHFTEDGFVEQGNDSQPLTEPGQDGLPDENGVWGSYYVRADDPQWRSIVFDKFDYLKGLGVDGYFLDTVDTASPWGEYGATRPGMLELVKALRERYPNQFMIANRGLFLLDDGPGYGQAVDGIMFESFLTLWNYATERADRSPWLRWHVQALDDSVGPAARTGAFHLFFLEYLSPDQPDLALFLNDQNQLLEGVPYTRAFSEPSLKTVYPDLLGTPPGNFQGHLDKLTVTPQGGGRYQVEIQSSPLSDQVIFDFRITDRSLPTNRWQQLPRAQLRRVKQEGNTTTFEGTGLNKATTYHAYARLMGKTPSAATKALTQSLRTPDETTPSQVTEVELKPLEQGLEVRWKADSLTADSYRVTVGPDPFTATQTVTVKSSPAEVRGLQNNQTYWVVVTGVTSDGQTGAPSWPEHGMPKDRTPPAAPQGLAVTQEGDHLVIHWNKVEAESYKVYCVPAAEKLRIPLRTEETRLETGPVRPGSYRVFVTAVDDEGNESRPAESKRIEVH